MKGQTTLNYFLQSFINKSAFKFIADILKYFWCYSMALIYYLLKKIQLSLHSHLIFLY